MYVINIIKMSYSRFIVLVIDTAAPLGVRTDVCEVPLSVTGSESG